MGPSGPLSQALTERQQNPKKMGTAAEKADPPGREKSVFGSGRELWNYSITLSLYICDMVISIESRLRYGLLLGFQLYNPDDEDPYYEIVIDLLVIRLSFAWMPKMD